MMKYLYHSLLLVLTILSLPTLANEGAALKSKQAVIANSAELKQFVDYYTSPGRAYNKKELRQVLFDEVGSEKSESGLTIIKYDDTHVTFSDAVVLNKNGEITFAYLSLDHIDSFYYLNNFDKLKGIYLYQGGLSGTHLNFNQLTNLSQLSEVRLSDTGVSKLTFSEVHKLSSLVVSVTPISEIVNLKSATDLRFFEIKYSGLTSLDELKNATMLKRLILENNRKLTAIPDITNFKVLEELLVWSELLNEIPSINDAYKLRHLKQLDISEQD